jgi:sensor histidine kinase YesM
MNLRKPPISWGIAILIAIGLGLLWSLRDYLFLLYLRENYEFEWPRLWLHVANYSTWGILFPLVHHWIRRTQEHQERYRLIGSILLIGFGLSVLHELVSNILFFGMLHFTGKELISADTFRHIFRALPAALISRMVEFGIIYTIYSAINFQRKLRDQRIAMAEIQSQLSGAQLNALRLQLQPHFLFNTLNTISALMEFDKKEAQRIVSRLGSLLRVVLDQEKSNLIPLREELEFIQNYLKIEQTRFQDRLDVEFDIEEQAQQVQVPSLILQPLVENAIKHGFASQSGDGKITISGRITDGQELLLEVRDNGKGSTAEKSALLQKGIGLQNVRERLSLLYGEQAGFGYESAPGEGFVVTLAIPTQKPTP